MTSTKLPKSAHTSYPWRIHELTRDFQLEDVWALPTPGGPGELPRLVSGMVEGDFPEGAPALVRALWAARWKIGARFGWDEPKTGLDSRVPSLAGRLPDDLREAPTGPDTASFPFTALYLLEDEWAAEMANRTVHVIMHLGWVEDGAGGHHGQMAVLVKPNGLLGAGYMAMIKPFRHLIVYPAFMRWIERTWRAHTDGAPLAPR